jgi:hypothetical protein
MTSADDVVREEYQPYHALSRTAIISLVIGLISFAVVWFPLLLVIPALGFLIGCYAYRVIRRYPDELTGKVPAILGLVLCGALFAGGVVAHSVAYATEVPEGHLRITFANLQPVPEHPRWPIPPDALKLDGQRVFIKGYLYPDGQQRNIKRFVLIPDLGTCCFGGQPALTDMVEVTLQDPLRTEFSRRKRKLGGVFKVDRELKPVSGLNGVYYQMTVDHLR